MAAANLAAAAFVSIAFFGAGTRLSLRHALEAFAVALVFAICIGVPSAIMIPRLSKPLWRFPFPINWIGLVAAMFVIAIAGSAATIGILIVSDYIPAGAFGAWFLGSIRYAIITTLIFGISISAYEMLRGQLDEALLTVRTKERDEAEARRLAAEAQLVSLESRVQPHFLFNTLNSIASLIPTDPKGAEKMTGQLASLLRSSLDGADRPLVPLAQEVETVREYLDIERVRFGDRLRCRFDVDQSAEAVLLPRFSLQTLVENAVKYAVAPRRDGGSVAIAARMVDSRVRIEVGDDGSGFDPTAIPSNHGLDALRRRLALTFGEEAHLDVRSSPAGTTVRIDIPRSA
jgi:LytS/YehU family sensor histidine kinase